MPRFEFDRIVAAVGLFRLLFDSTIYYLFLISDLILGLRLRQLTVTTITSPERRPSAVL